MLGGADEFVADCAFVLRSSPERSLGKPLLLPVGVGSTEEGIRGGAWVLLEVGGVGLPEREPVL